MIILLFAIFECILSIQLDRMNNKTKNNQISENNQLSFQFFVEIPNHIIILCYMLFIVLKHFSLLCFEHY